MKRICQEFAYSDAPIAQCFWSETVEQVLWPQLTEDHKADVVIIGAGYTGLNAALTLARQGASVVIIDAKHPGWGASGRNGGFCCVGGSKASDRTLRKRYGEVGLREWRMTERAAVDHVDGEITGLNLQVDRHSDGETMVAHTHKWFHGLENEARDIEEYYGVTPRVLTAQEMAAQGMMGPFHGAMTNPIGFALNPAKYSAGLAQAVTSAGVVGFGESPVTRVSRDGRAWSVTTPQGSVLAENVVIATNGYSSETIPKWLSGRYLPVQSNVIVTRPLSDAEIAAQGWHSTQMTHDTRQLLHYFRLMPNKRMLFGMRGGVGTGQTTHNAMRKVIRQHFDRMFPAWAQVETPHFWAGLLCMNMDLTPFVGPVPNQPGLFAALGYHGNGVAMGSYAGRLVADLVGGKDHRPEVMKSEPWRFPGGALRRISLVPAYAYYGVRDL